MKINGWQRIGIIVLIGLAISAIFYQRHKELVVKIDNWWNVDYAREGCRGRAAADNPYNRPCIGDPVTEVRAYEAQLRTFFANDASCDGIVVATFTSPNQAASKAASKAVSDSVGQLMIDFYVDKYLQDWTLAHGDDDHMTTGHDDPKEMVHTICQVMKQSALGIKSSPSEQSNHLFAADSIGFQDKCAKQAYEEFTYHKHDYEEFSKKNPGTINFESGYYTNHYNEKLNKCFVLIEDNVTFPAHSPGATPNIGYVKLLEDAFEGKGYGNYSWISVEGKKFSEVPPTICHVTIPSGEEKICNSFGEFDELVKYYHYMQ